MAACLGDCEKEVYTAHYKPHVSGLNCRRRVTKTFWSFFFISERAEKFDLEIYTRNCTIQLSGRGTVAEIV